MGIIRLFYSILIISAVMFLNYVHAEESDKNIIIKDAWVRAMPPSQRTTAAYMSIENRTDKQIYLLSASTDVAEKVEIHEMSHVNGMMRMRMIHQLKIPSQMVATFNPEGLHLMIINLTEPIKKGDTVPIILTFSEGNRMTVNAVVREEE